jgi:GH25 family lysozyme M1 (1,4-beta-N-acetylmuramidase)
MTEQLVRRTSSPRRRRHRYVSQTLSEPLESRLLMARVEGIDVSQFQGVIDWNQVAANGKQFVFMRASRTNLTKDPTFETNLAGATAAGLLVGTYHYTLPANIGDDGPPVDPVLDAQKYFAAAGSTMTNGFLPPVIDAEAAGPTLGKTDYSEWINAFSDEIFRLSGVRPIVYANINYAVNYLDASVAAKHKLWLARYNNGNDPTGVDPETAQPDLASFHPNPYGAWNVPVGGARSDDSWRFWQYTSTGDGIATGVSSVNLDLDLYNGSLDQLKREFLIGFQKNYGTPGNNPFAVAGDGAVTTIQAEDYDIGGQDVAYYDSSPTDNVTVAYRTSRREGVDVSEIGADNNAYRVTQTAAGEWVEYTFDVGTAGDYQLDFYLSQTAAGGKVHAEIDGQALPSLDVPVTGNLATFLPASQETPLSAGTHVLRVTFDAVGANGTAGDFDKVAFTKLTPQANFPQNATPFAISPDGGTTIEAEQYDIGGPNVSYSDTTPNRNTGGGFRTSTREGVDVAAIDGVADGFRVTDTAPGEYLEYTIDVAQAGNYQLSYLLSQTEIGGTFHAEVDGQALPTLAVPDTENLSVFATVRQTATLSAGQHVLRLSFDAAAPANGRVADLDKIVISPAAATAPPAQAPVGSAFATEAAYVRGGPFAPQNYAFAGDLLVQRGKGSTNTYYSYLKFDLTNAASFGFARLRLVGRLGDAVVPSVKVGVYSADKLKAPLTEGSVTFKKKPAAKKLRGTIEVTGTADGAYELDLTSYVLAEIAAGRKVVTLMLRNLTKTDSPVIFSSDESGTAPALVLF